MRRLPDTAVRAEVRRLLVKGRDEVKSIPGRDKQRKLARASRGVVEEEFRFGSNYVARTSAAQPSQPGQCTRYDCAVFVNEFPANYFHALPRTCLVDQQHSIPLCYTCLCCSHWHISRRTWSSYSHETEHFESFC